MPKYRTKIVEKEAFQMTKSRRWDNSEWPDWLHEAWNKPIGKHALWPAVGKDELMCGTLEGPHIVDFDDYIIQGLKGEIYPCKPDIFKATYELVEG